MVRAGDPADALYALVEGVLLPALTASPPSSSVMETAQSRLALTHPSRSLAFEQDDSKAAA